MSLLLPCDSHVDENLHPLRLHPARLHQFRRRGHRPPASPAPFGGVSCLPQMNVTAPASSLHKPSNRSIAKTARYFVLCFVITRITGSSRPTNRLPTDAMPRLSFHHPAHSVRVPRGLLCNLLGMRTVRFWRQNRPTLHHQQYPTRRPQIRRLFLSVENRIFASSTL